MRLLTVVSEKGTGNASNVGRGNRGGVVLSFHGLRRAYLSAWNGCGPQFAAAVGLRSRHVSLIQEMTVQTATTVLLESVYYESERGWMTELRLDGKAFSTYGPYADRHDAELWAMEIGKRAAEHAEKVKADLAAHIETL